MASAQTSHGARSGSGSRMPGRAIGGGACAARHRGSGGLTRPGFGRVGEAKVNVGNNILEICERRRIEIRLAGFQGVTREKVSGTFFAPIAVQAGVHSPLSPSRGWTGAGENGGCENQSAGPKRRQSGIAQICGASGSTSRPRVTTNPRRQARGLMPGTRTVSSVSRRGRAWTG